MQLLWKLAVIAVLAMGGLCSAVAQDEVDDGDGPSMALQNVAERKSSRTASMTSDDRLSLLAAALDAHVQRESEPDCSHLVHEIYQAAGLPYPYTPSSDLYEGIEGFQRVKAPLPGDLVVWRGHVGIVVKPSQHIFFSYLSAGPGTDDYETAYWRHRGRPRFYRYVKK